MFDMEMGSVHSRGSKQMGHVFTCRPDDPGRSGTVVLGYCPRSAYVGTHLVRSAPLHTFEVGFRVTGMYDYMNQPHAMDLQHVRTHLFPTVRMHIEVQASLAGAGADLAVTDILWKD